jgi:hypothetical protein
MKEEEDSKTKAGQLHYFRDERSADLLLKLCIWNKIFHKIYSRRTVAPWK